MTLFSSIPSVATEASMPIPGMTRRSGGGVTDFCRKVVAPAVLGRAAAPVPAEAAAGAAAGGAAGAAAAGGATAGAAAGEAPAPPGATPPAAGDAAAGLAAGGGAAESGVSRRQEPGGSRPTPPTYAKAHQWSNTLEREMFAVGGDVRRGLVPGRRRPGTSPRPTSAPTANPGDVGQGSNLR